MCACMCDGGTCDSVRVRAKRQIFALPKIVRYRNKSGLQYYGTLVCVGVSVIMDTEAAFLSASWQGEGTQPKAKA